ELLSHMVVKQALQIFEVFEVFLGFRFTPDLRHFRRALDSWACRSTLGFRHRTSIPSAVKQSYGKHDPQPRQRRMILNFSVGDRQCQQEAQACQGSVKSHRKGSLPPPTLTPLPGAGGEGPPLISLSFMPRPPDSLEATRPVLAAIGALEPELARAGDQELRDKAGALRRQAREGALL